MHVIKSMQSHKFSQKRKFLPSITSHDATASRTIASTAVVAASSPRPSVVSKELIDFNNNWLKASVSLRRKS